MAKIVIHPGYANSPPNHWQHYLAMRHSHSVWINQASWVNVDCQQWIEKIKQTIDEINDGIIFVAHSLGCIAFLHTILTLQQSSLGKIQGALLVAPCDTEQLQDPEIIIAGFDPIPLSPLAFPTILVASMNDSYLSHKRAQQFAKDLNVNRFINLGYAGHINGDSNYGEWQEADLLIEQLQTPNLTSK